MNTKQIRQTILDLAIRGELVPQDPTDEPASVLLERIHAEKEQLIKDKKLKRDKKESEPIDEVPFELPEGWEWCRLGEIGNNIQYGLSNPSSTFGKYKILRITDIQNNSVSWDTVPSVDIEEEEVNSFLLKKGDILFARTGATVGKSYLVSDLPCSSVFASYLIRISVFEFISVQYIKYFFESDTYWEQITDKSVGIGQPNVNGTSLKTLLIPLPPLAEQHRIVEKVEQLLTIVDTVEQLQEELKALIKQTKNQVLNYAIAGKLTHQDPNDEPAEELLKRIGKTTAADTPYEKLPKGWAWCRLGDIFDIKSSKRVLQSDWKDEGVPFYRAREIVKLSEKRLTDNDLFISKDLYMELKSTYGVPQKGDVLVSAVGTIGKSYVVKEEDVFYYKDASVLCLHNIYKINTNYISLILNTEFIQKQMYENSKGTTVDTITIQKAKEYIIPLPPLAEQHRIVEKIESFFASFDQIEKGLS